MTAPPRVRTWVAAAPRVSWHRIMLAHRRYTSANGDALAGSMTYALLVCGAPAVLLTMVALDAIGVDTEWVAGALHRAGAVLLPVEVAGAIDRLPPPGLALRVSLVVPLMWTSVRLARAIRTGVRAMCGQDAGSGNPVFDAALDGVLGVLLLTALTGFVAGTAVMGAYAWSGVLGSLGLALIFAGIMLRGSWAVAGRPSGAAALRASLVAAAIVALLTLGAGHYFAVTAAIHSEIYQAAGELIGVLVWCSLVCRILLRATAWASTAEMPRPAGATSARPMAVLERGQRDGD